MDNLVIIVRQFNKIFMIKLIRWKLINIMNYKMKYKIYLLNNEINYKKYMNNGNLKLMNEISYIKNHKVSYLVMSHHLLLEYMYT